jgi:sorbose reductase
MSHLIRGATIPPRRPSGSEQHHHFLPLTTPPLTIPSLCYYSLGKSLAREWRDFARVNSVSPGFFDTDLGAAPAVQHQAFNSAVLGRQGNVKELKGVYLVRFRLWKGV